MRQIPHFLAAAVALFGGAYLGFSACGGVLWHAHAVIGTLLLLTAAVVAVPFFRNRPVMSRAVLPLIILATFTVSRAAAAQFYPATPESWSVFLQLFARALVGSTC